MMKQKKKYRLLATVPLVQSEQTPPYNAINGSDSESLAAAKFIAAFRGEVSWGSRQMDNRKIDLILNCEHPWFPDERLVVLAQVKSGNTYGETTNEGVKVKSRAVAECQRTSHSICLIWVDRENSKIFWAYIHPRTKSDTRQYGRNHELTPAIRYDLARCMAVPFGGAAGASGLTISYQNTDLKQLREIGKKCYKDISSRSISMPTLGLISLTRLAWRHMFRSGRSLAYKKRSLRLIPYLSQILTRFPDDQAIITSEYWEEDGYQYRSLEHLLKYRNAAVAGPGTADFKAIVLIRVIEEIRFPADWADKAMLSQEVARRVVLRSAYFKRIKEDTSDSKDGSNCDTALS